MQKELDKALRYLQKNRIKAVILSSVIFISTYNAAKLLHLYHVSPGKNMAMRNDYFFEHMNEALRNITPAFTCREFLNALLIIGVICLFIYLARPAKKNMKNGVEYGAARWGNHESIAPYIDKDQYHNIILSATERLSMSGRMPVMEHNRNKNVIVIGGSGSGKTYSFVTPNLLQMDCSYVVTDPKGSL